VPETGHNGKFLDIRGLGRYDKQGASTGYARRETAVHQVELAPVPFGTSQPAPSRSGDAGLRSGSWCRSADGRHVVLLFYENYPGGISDDVCAGLLAVHVKSPHQMGHGNRSRIMSNLTALRRLVGRVHRDERGAVSLETILIIGAIALPILIFIIKFGWPRIRNYFYTGMTNLEQQSDKVTNGQ
jgi:hypothetical protein